MKSIASLLLLPLQAPMLLVLLLVSTYLGTHMGVQEGPAIFSSGMYWGVEFLQSMIVVVICSIPDLLLRQVSALMAASRALSLVITLLIVILGGLYLLHLDILSNVLILASSVMLARLDLARIRIVNPSLLITLLLLLIVISGMMLGHVLSH